MSHDMLVALTDTCQEEEKVGAVFVKFGPRLRAAYGVYCRNHDSASALVEKVGPCSLQLRFRTEDKQ